MTISTYHFHPELLDLLIQTIPLLFRSKADVVMFFRGAAVPDSLTADISQRVRQDSRPSPHGRFDGRLYLDVRLLVATRVTLLDAERACLALDIE